MSYFVESADLQQQIVDEINKFAAMTFDQKQQERVAIRNTRVTRFKAWAKEKEAEYPDLARNDSWKANLKDLDKSMAFSYEFTEKDRETHDAMQLHWSKITLAEFRTFIGIVLAIRCISSKRFDDYFNETDPKYGNEWIAMHISKARFHQILNNFHYNIDTVLARVSELCQTHWTPYQRVTFDETIMPFLGMFYGLVSCNGWS